MLSRGRFWNADLSKVEDVVVLSLLRDSLPEEFRELREFKIEVPLESWNRVLKHARTDRKLLGGIMLDFTNYKDQLSVAVGSDRLFRASLVSNQNRKGSPGNCPQDRAQPRRMLAP